MAGTVEQVGPNRYRERFGRYDEDFMVGDIDEHRPGRTISEADNTCFSLLSLNSHPLHFDAEYAKHAEFGRCIVSSPLTLAAPVGMSVTELSQKAIAKLGWKQTRLTHPVFAGSTLTSESEVLEKREPKSRPNAGIVSVRTRGFNQNGVLANEFDRTMLIGKRGFDTQAKANH